MFLGLTMSHSYDIGDQAVLTAVFTNATSGAAIDPTAVYVQIKTPSDVITTYQYGVDPEVTNPSTGTYQISVSITEHGIWYYRWYSTGTGMAAGEGRFDAKSSEFD